jgi:hypothetical protein
MEETIICSRTLLQTDVAVMDFSKAFDKVDQQRLILKLKRMDIINKTSNWIGHGYHIDFCHLCI